MADAFLGTGWNYPIQLDDQGQIELAVQEQSVQQAIWMILDTSPGERVMHPDFGCGIHDLVFAVNNAATMGRVETEVREALDRWAPRIELLDVTATIDPAQRNQINIEIDYRVRTTNNRFNLVYPFYLE
jgi:phage baseplate assembly protein W